ncbi:hypothetical protein DK853_37970, partial [Klebsiella oxytoca]
CLQDKQRNRAVSSGFVKGGDNLLKQLHIIIRLLLFLVGIIGCSGFIVPFLTRRILNIGNLGGLVICILIVLYAVFMPKIHQW